MKIEPLHDTIAIIRDKPEDPGKLVIIPDTARRLSWKGKVLAIGPEVYDIQVGDLVFLPMYHPADMWLEGDHILFYREEEILAYVREET